MRLIQVLFWLMEAPFQVEWSVWGDRLIRSAWLARGTVFRSKGAARRDAMDLALEIVNIIFEPNKRLVPIPLGARLCMGRTVDADVVIYLGSISRRHCEVWRDDGGVWLRDLQSCNGTTVYRDPADKGEQIQEATRLRPCDQFQAEGALARLIISGPVDPAWLRWNDGTVRKIAQRIQTGKGMEDQSLLVEGFLLLHDALLDAGCDDVELLEHCRTPCQYREQCSLLRLLLGDPT